MRKTLGALSALIALSGPTHAATVVVTTPPVLTNPGGPTLNDPLASGAWIRREVRAMSSIGINGTYARSGNGSVYMQGANGTSKGDFEYYGAPVFPATLGSLSTLSYEWYRDSLSNNPGAQAPALKLYVDFDGVPGGAGGLLIYEPIYNGFGPNVPTDTWTSSGTLNTTTGIFWWREFGGPGSDDSNGNSFSRTINDYFNSANINPGFSTLSPNHFVVGMNVGFGSGWNGVFQGAVDNVTIGFAGGDPTRWNFELFEQASPIPEPGSLLLFGLSVVGLTAYRRVGRSTHAKTS